MKIRIALTILLLAAWGFINRGIIYPVDVVTKNALAVNTVNGGDGAYIAQEAYNASGNMLTPVSSIVLFFLLLGLWLKVINAQSNN
jgi:hypothetical protein